MPNSPAHVKFTAIYMIATTFGEYLANFYGSKMNNIRSAALDDGNFALIFDPAENEPPEDAQVREDFFKDLQLIVNDAFSDSFAMNPDQKAIQTKDMRDFLTILRAMHETFEEESKQEIKEALELSAEEVLPGGAEVNLAEKPYLLNALQKDGYASLSQVYADMVAYEALDGDDELFAFLQTYSFEQIENAITAGKAVKQKAPSQGQGFYMH